MKIYLVSPCEPGREITGEPLAIFTTREVAERFASRRDQSVRITERNLVAEIPEPHAGYYE